MLKSVANLYHRNKIAVDVALLIIGLIFTFSFFLWNSEDDLFYFYYNTPYYKDSFFIFLFLKLGDIWRNSVCDSVLSFRSLGWICGVLSLLIPYLSLLSQKEQKKNLHILAFCLIIASHMAGGIFNTDSLTVLILICISCLLLNHGGLNKKKILLLSLFSGISAAFRFPNIIVLAFVYPCILYSKWGKNKIGANIYGLSYLLLSLLLYYIAVSVTFTNLDIWGIITNYISNPSSSSDTSHGIKALIIKYITDLACTAIAFSPILITILVNEKSFIHKNMTKKAMPIIAFAITIISLHYIGKDQSNPISLNHKVFSLFAIFLLYYNYYKTKQISLTLTTTIVLIGFVACAGSNGGIKKIFMYFVSLTPVIVVYLKRKNDMNACLTSVLTAICLFSTICFFRDKIPHCSWTGIGKWKTSVFDYNCYLHYNTYQGFLTSEDYERYKKEIAQYEKYGVKDHTFFYGNPSGHELYGITGTKVPYFIPYYMTQDDTVAIDNMLRHFRKDPQAVLFDYTGSKYLKSKMSENKIFPIYSAEKLNTYKNK